jgi:hypothetical protein
MGEVGTGLRFRKTDRLLGLVFLKYIKADVTYEGVRHVETYSHPRASIREAIYNAIRRKASVRARQYPPFNLSRRHVILIGAGEDVELTIALFYFLL